MLQMIQPVICQVNCLEIKIYNVTTNSVSKGESFMRKQAFFYRDAKTNFHKKKYFDFYSPFCLI